MGSNLCIFSSQSIVLKRKGIHSSLWKGSELKRLFWKYFLSELSQAGFLLGLRVFLCGSKFSTSSRCFLQKKGEKQDYQRHLHVCSPQIPAVLFALESLWFSSRFPTHTPTFFAITKKPRISEMSTSLSYP